MMGAPRDSLCKTVVGALALVTPPPNADEISACVGITLAVGNGGVGMVQKEEIKWEETVYREISSIISVY